MSKKTNKLPMEVTLVITGDQTLPTGQSLVNSTTALNIASGQAGVISFDPNSATRTVGTFLTPGDNSNAVQAIKVIQGTPASANTTLADPWEVTDKAYLESGIIRKNQIRSVAVKKYVPPVLGGVAVTNITTPVNNGAYRLYVKLDSPRLDREYSTMNDDVIVGSSPKTDFTAAAITNSTDFVLSHILADLNSQSMAVNRSTGGKGNQPFVVFGTKAVPATVTLPSNPTLVLTGGVITSVTGGTGGSGITSVPILTISGGSPTTQGSIVPVVSTAGVVTGYTIVSGGAGYGTTPTAALTGGGGQVIGTITPTTVISFQVVNGITQKINSSVEMCSMLAKLVQDNAALTATSTIELVDYTTNGAMAKIDGLIVVGLPQRQAAIFDNVEQLQTKVIVNPAQDFISGVDCVTTTCFPVEGTGQGVKWKINDDWRARVPVHTNQVQPHGDWFAEGKSYINVANNYTSYIIEYFDVENTLTLEEIDPKKVSILFRSEIPSSFTVNVNNIIARYAANNAQLVPTVTSNDGGTGTASATTVAAVEASLTVWLEHARTTGIGFPVLGDATPGGVYLS